MPKQGTWLRTAAVAAIASVSLSLSALSVAQPNQRADATMNPKKHYLRQRELEIPPKIYGAAPSLPGCTWPYRNMLPPCMSTWPQGDPNYHGTMPLARSEIIPMR